MGTLIDTSVVVAAERGTLDLEAVLRTADTFAMSTVTLSELLHGVHRAPRGRARTLREAFVEHVIARLPAARPLRSIHSLLERTLASGQTWQPGVSPSENATS